MFKRKTLAVLSILASSILSQHVIANAQVRSQYNDANKIQSIFKSENDSTSFESNGTDDSTTTANAGHDTPEITAGISSISNEFKNEFMQNDTTGTIACTSNNKDAIRFNKSTGKIELCNGSGWTNVQAGTTTPDTGGGGTSASSCNYVATVTGHNFNSSFTYYTIKNKYPPYDTITNLKNKNKTYGTIKTGKVYTHRHGDMHTGFTSYNKFPYTYVTDYICLSGRIIKNKTRNEMYTTIY